MTKLPSFSPDIRLFGKVDPTMLSEFFRQQQEAPADKPLVVELSSQGGDADIGRRIALELRWWQQQEGREVFFLGKSFVYSAAVTIMGGVPVDHRFLSADTELLLHERKLHKTLRLEGSLRSAEALLRDTLAEVESGKRLEQHDFASLIEGSRVDLHMLLAKVRHSDWYVTAQEALEMRLVGGVV